MVYQCTAPSSNHKLVAELSDFTNQLDLDFSGKISVEGTGMKFMISSQPPASVFLAAGLGSVAKFMSNPSSACPPQAHHKSQASGLHGQTTGPLATFCRITFRLCLQDGYETDCRALGSPTARREKSRLHAQLSNPKRHPLPTLLSVLRLRGWKANIREGADTVWLGSEA